MHELPGGFASKQERPFKSYIRCAKYNFTFEWKVLIHSQTHVCRKLDVIILVMLLLLWSITHTHRMTVGLQDLNELKRMDNWTPSLTASLPG